MFNVTRLIGFGAGAGCRKTPSVTVGDADTINSSLYTYTWSGFDFGSDNPNRWIVACCIGDQGDAEIEPETLTLDYPSLPSVNFTKVVFAGTTSGGDAGLTIYYAHVPYGSGANGTFTWVFDSSNIDRPSRARIMCHEVYTNCNNTTLQVRDTASDVSTNGNTSVTLASLKDDIIVSYAHNDDYISSTGGFTATNINEDRDFEINGNYTSFAGSDVETSNLGRTVSLSSYNAAQVQVAAVFYEI